MNLFGDDDWDSLNDPDVAAIAGAGGDPYAAVRHKAQVLLDRLAEFPTETATPFERIKSLASLAGYTVRPCDGSMSEKGRAAMFIPNGSPGTRGQIIYDPTLPMGRVIFSIGHEISHSFFPNSNAGVQFRSVHPTGSKRGRQLEMLCEYGASLLVMPEREFLKAVERYGFGFAQVELIRDQFWTSFEATTYRLADLADFSVAAIKFKYRLAKKDMNTRPSYGNLFPMPDPAVVHPRYRVQSSRRSQTFDVLIPYNKSVPETSCIYRAGRTAGIQSGFETVAFSGKRERASRVEAVQAPYQPPGADPTHPDILAFFYLLQV